MPKAIVRRAIDSDVLGIYHLYRDHLDNRKYGARMTYVPERLLTYVEDMIANDDICMLVSVIEKNTDIITGVISAMIVDSPFADEKLCREITWIRNPKYPSSGLTLLRRLEDWARSKGANVAVIGCTDDKVAKLLSLRGYAKSELTYERNF
jgi:hypothetical protein